MNVYQELPVSARVAPDGFVPAGERGLTWAECRVSLETQVYERLGRTVEPGELAAWADRLTVVLGDVSPELEVAASFAADLGARRVRERGLQWAARGGRAYRISGSSSNKAIEAGAPLWRAIREVMTLGFGAADIGIFGSIPLPPMGKFADPTPSCEEALRDAALRYLREQFAGLDARAKLACLDRAGKLLGLSKGAMQSPFALELFEERVSRVCGERPIAELVLLVSRLLDEPAAAESNGG